MTHQQPTTPPFSPESWGARPARFALIFVLAVYVVIVLFILVLVGLDRVRVASQPQAPLTTGDKASVALDTADRILSLLEVTIGAIALIVPLSLGVLIYIFQENRSTIVELTQKAERAETNAARSEKIVEETRKEAKEIGERVRDALTQIVIAEARDNFRDEEAKKSEEANLKRDLERDQAAQALQERIEQQKREVVDVSFTAQELLKRSYSDQHKLTKVDQFLEVRRHSAMCTSDDVIEATTAVVTLLEIAQFPAPDDDDDENPDGKTDKQRADRDMLLRREALRSLVSVREAQHVPDEIRERLLEVLREMTVSADHRVLQLEAKRTLRHLTE